MSTSFYNQQEPGDSNTGPLQRRCAYVVEELGEGPPTVELNPIVLGGPPRPIEPAAPRATRSSRRTTDASIHSSLSFRLTSYGLSVYITLLLLIMFLFVLIHLVPWYINSQSYRTLVITGLHTLESKNNTLERCHQGESGIWRHKVPTAEEDEHALCRNAGIYVDANRDYLIQLGLVVRFKAFWALFYGSENGLYTSIISRFYNLFLLATVLSFVMCIAACMLQSSRSARVKRAPEIPLAYQ